MVFMVMQYYVRYLGFTLSLFDMYNGKQRYFSYNNDNAKLCGYLTGYYNYYHNIIK